MRRLYITVGVALLSWSVVLQAAAPTLGVHGANSGTTTYTLSPSTLTDGSTLVIGIGQVSGDADQSYSVGDTINTYASAVLSANTGGVSLSRKCQIFYAPNISTTAGALTVTITVANGTSTSRSQFVEVLGAHLTTPLNAADSVAESADTMSHTAAVSMTTDSDIFVYSIMAANSTLGTLTPTASPAFDGTLAADFSVNSVVSQHYTGATGLTTNTLAWDSGTSRTTASCSAAFIAPAAADGRAPSLTTLMARGR